MGAVEVEVELFIESRGPEHVFKTRLGGWDENRLDLEQIMIDHKLRAIHAYSLSSGRGQRLMFNPRNGLSFIPYSGKADSIIRLDGDPKRSVMAPIAKITAGTAFIVAVVACLFMDVPAEWVDRLRNASGGRLLWVACFVTMIFLQIYRQSRPRKRRLL